MNIDAITNTLIEITQDVDDKLADLCIKHNLDPVTMSTIIFARLTRMNFEMGNSQRFIDLVRKCADDAELLASKAASEHVH